MSHCCAAFGLGRAGRILLGRFADSTRSGRVLLGGLVAGLLTLALPPSLSPQTIQATIHRDTWGVPHVFSETDAGAVFGMAWALAEDDWPLIEENYLQALGRRAELAGAAAVPGDWMARALRIVPLSITEYENTSPRMRGLLDAFAAGMNRWLHERPSDELRVLDRIEPWYPLALIRFKYYQNEFLGYAGLRSAWVRPILARSAAASRGPGIAASRSDVRSADLLARLEAPYPFSIDAQFDGYGRRPQGSNQWALAPSRTADRSTLLLINPHQSFVGVQRYAEIHLDSREGLRFSGLTVFGFLLPYMGNNDRLGWAYTDNYADHSDLYGLTFDDDTHPLNYRYADGYRAADAWTDSIRVRTATGMERRTFRFWSTHHGPIVGVAEDGRPLAVRLARMVEGGWFDQWDRMIRARSRDEWKAAVALLHVAYMNTMYADADGNIGYIYNSAVPRRHPGIDPSGILDGANPDAEWQGFHTLDELPQVWNPDTGWLLNTNSTPLTATAGLTWRREDFPAYMIGAETDNARAVSSRRVLASLHSVTFDDFAERVWDSRLSEADGIVPELLAEWDALPASETKQALAHAIDRLRAWDRIADTASVETTWFIIANERRITAQRAGEQRTRPRLDGLADALHSLQAQWGTVDVPWGWLNRHQRPLPGAPAALDTLRTSLPIGGAPGALGSVFSYDSAPFASPGPRMGRGGNSFVKVVAFAPSIRAGSILNYGQSGDPASPHFFDQAALYAQRRFKPAWFTRADVVANAVRSYTVQQ